MFWDASSRRVCGHLLHYQCAQELSCLRRAAPRASPDLPSHRPISPQELPSKSCPLCRCDFDKAVVLPSLERQPEVCFRTATRRGLVFFF